jgi:hypothetical protein
MVLIKSEKAIFLKSYLEPEPELELEQETKPKFGFAVPWSQSRKKYFRLRKAGLRF